MAVLPIACLLLVVSADVITAGEADDVKVNYEPYEKTWETFKRDFGRRYGEEEEESRYSVFVQNLQLMESHNQEFLARKQSFFMDINQFTDQDYVDGKWTNCHSAADSGDEDSEDHADLVSRQKRQTRFCRKFVPPYNFTPPSSLDWNTEGFVTAVGEEGNCSSSYAFAVTTTVEAQMKMATGKLTPLSQQQLVDCYGGCNCGPTAEANLRYIQAVGGLMSSEDYPFVAASETCSFNNTKAQAKVSGCRFLVFNESLTKIMVASQGPVYVAMTVTNSFRHYKKGVYWESKCKAEKGPCRGYHSLAVVGYGHDATSGKDYWIVKNSWGTGWGQRGYGWIQRGNNTCGIASFSTVPVIGRKMGRGMDVLSSASTMPTTFSMTVTMQTALSMAVAGYVTRNSHTVTILSFLVSACAVWTSLP